MVRPTSVRAALMTLLAVLLVLPGTAAAAAWLSPVHVGGTTGEAPSPAVDASGNAIVGWQAGSPSVIQAARHAVGTPGFSALPNLSTDIANPNSSPVVVLNRSGNGLVAWVRSVGLMANKEIDILPLLPNGKTGVLKSVSAAGMSASNITAAINVNGDAVVAWEQGTQVVGVTRQGLSGAFTNTTTPDTIDGLGDSPVAAIDGAGNAIVVMHHNGFFQEISESHHVPGSPTWSPAATLAPSGGHSFMAPDVAANAGGATVVAFIDNDGGGNQIA